MDYKSIAKWIFIVVILGIFIAGGDLNPATIWWIVAIAAFVALFVILSFFVAEVVFKTFRR